MNKGETFKIDEKYHKAIKVHIEESKNSIIAFNAAINMKKTASENLWALIHDLHPELKDFSVNFNHESLEISIIGDKKDS